jgi:hypothetical protein
MNRGPSVSPTHLVIYVSGMYEVVLRRRCNSCLNIFLLIVVKAQESD